MKEMLGDVLAKKIDHFKNQCMYVTQEEIMKEKQKDK
jgi:hypothetical protein